MDKEKLSKTQLMDVPEVEKKPKGILKNSTRIDSVG